jgi:hypothetical protein
MCEEVDRKLGNLMEVEMIKINFLPYSVDDNNDGDEVCIPKWEIMTRILTYVQHNISLFLAAEDYDAEVEDIQGIARVIHGNPNISAFSSSAGFTFANLGPWCSALTLPSLERVTFGPSGARKRGPTRFAKPRAF